MPQKGFANIVELLEHYDTIGNQMEASTTAVTAGSAERPSRKFRFRVVHYSYSDPPSA